MDPIAWKHRSPLYIYYNEEKLDALLAEIYDSVEIQFQQSYRSGTKAQMKLAARFGSLLAWLGIGEASTEIGGELAKEKTRVSISSVSIYNKVQALINYYLENEPLSCFDVANGYKVNLNREGAYSSYQGILPIHQINGIGRIAGKFHLRRLNPLQNNDTSVVRDLLEHKPHLWICETVEESAIKAEMPFLTTNFRHTSQSAMLVLDLRPFNSPIWIEGIGLLSWTDGALRCDPLAWGVIGYGRA